MGTYVVNSKKEQQELLTRCGLNSFVDLYKDIPEEVLLKDGLNLPKGLAELEVKRKFEDLADKNKVYKHIFRGAGAYNHYIPSVVKAIASKEEFVTAYTPYQAEISQGILQAIFEFQTMICELTGMQIANASVYDGATAVAEATAMCYERKKANTVYVSATTNPQVIEVRITRDFPTKDIEIETPVAKCVAKTLAGKKVAVVPILRAGLGMVNGIINLIPAAKIGHIGLYRDEKT